MVGVTDAKIEQWEKDVTEGMHQKEKDNTKEIQIPPILYTKYNTIPKVE